MDVLVVKTRDFFFVYYLILLSRFFLSFYFGWSCDSLSSHSDRFLACENILLLIPGLRWNSTAPHRLMAVDSFSVMKLTWCVHLFCCSLIPVANWKIISSTTEHFLAAGGTKYLLRKHTKIVIKFNNKNVYNNGAASRSAVVAVRSAENLVKSFRNGFITSKKISPAMPQLQCSPGAYIKFTVKNLEHRRRQTSQFHRHFTV